jgi:hypothetical protein
MKKVKSIQRSHETKLQSVPLDSVMKSFLVKEAKRQGISLSALIRLCIVSTYPELKDTDMKVHDMKKSTELVVSSARKYFSED